MTATGGGVLSREEKDAARERLPIVYVDVLLVRVNDVGTVIALGLLVRTGGGRADPAGAGLGRGC